MSSSSPSSRVSFEISIHAILKRIKEKAEFQTNFATISIQIRYLQHILRLYDRPIHPGCISLDDFKHFLLERMNFISLLPTEIEYVFYFYDNELTGFLDYKNFLFQLYQTSDVYLPLLTTDAVNTFERIRLAFLPTEYDKYQQHNFLLFLIRLRERVICNVYGFCSRSFLVEQLFELIVTRGKSNADVVSKKDLANVIKFFDYRQDDTVFLSMFIRYLKSVMSAYRMRLVRTVFQLLSREGYIRLSDIRSCYHVTPNRTLRYRGKTFTRAVPEELLEYFFGHNFRRMNTNEILTWEVFNEYYQCISLSIESDELFELVLRHSWLIPNGKLDGKPMANDVEDVFERSLSSSYDSTTTKDELGISISPLASRSFDFGPVASRSISRSFDAHHSGSPRFVSTPGGTMVRTPVRTPLRHTIASLRSPPEATLRLDDEDRKGSSAFTPPVRREAFMGVSETKDIKI